MPSARCARRKRFGASTTWSILTIGNLSVSAAFAPKTWKNDYEAPRRRERTLRNAAQRRRRWVSRKWKVSAKGNAYLNTDGLNITVYRRTRILWGARIKEPATGRSVTSKGRYTSEDAAKLAAFDAMIILKHERGSEPVNDFETPTVSIY